MSEHERLTQRRTKSKNTASNIHTMKHMSMVLGLECFRSLCSSIFFGLFGESICVFFLSVASFQFRSFFFLSFCCSCSRWSATSHNAQHIHRYKYTHLLTTMIITMIITKRVNRKWINVCSIKESTDEMKYAHARTYACTTNTSKIKNRHWNKRPW